MYSMRLRSIGGNLTAEQLRSVAELADKYGRGYVHVTTRQGVEIPWVHIENYDRIQREIRALGLTPGTCGPRIRTVIACPGNEICNFGLVDARGMAEILDATFFGREVPMKTKLAVSGCPNSCAKPQENDLGFVGAVEPVYRHELCIGCGLCAEVCPGKAITMQDGHPVLETANCLHEGNCISSCPVDAWVPGRQGYHTYAGGKIGRRPQLGVKVAEFVQEGQVVPLVEAALQVFKTLGKTHERLADTINRVGAEEFTRQLHQEWAQGQDDGQWEEAANS
ncbi:nitrite reductase [Clostridiales bacterium PH28_bin88]|nr:nitrite reductase [Clostridiales bacterium PH28_bin88]